MTRFTDNPYELIMTETDEDREHAPCPSALPPDHPCYGCGNYGSPCVGICTKELCAYLLERRGTSNETGDC